MALPILRLTEEACASLATSAIAGSPDGITALVYTGIDNLEKSAPCVICYAESAKEDFPHSAIYNVSTNIMIKEMAYDTNKSSSLSDLIFKTFLSTVTKGTLNSYSTSSYYVYEYWVEDTTNRVDGDSWIQELRLNMVSAVV
jgi:hypothetical protein